MVKSGAERMRAFRERRKATKPPKKPAKSNQQRCREYRARQKAQKSNANLEQFQNDDEDAQSLQNMNIKCGVSTEHSYDSNSSTNIDLTQIKSEVIEEIYIKEEPGESYEESTDPVLPDCTLRESILIKDQFDQFAEFMSLSLRQLPEELANQAQTELRHVLIKFQLLAAESHETK